MGQESAAIGSDQGGRHRRRRGVTVEGCCLGRRYTRHPCHRRRCEGIDLDPVRGSRGGQTPGEPDDPALGGRVGEVVRQSEHPRRGRHDDTAIPLADHVRPGGAGGVERPDDMDGQVSLQVVQIGIRQRGPPDDASVVDQNVEATEVLDGGIDQGLRASGHGHVAGVGDGGSAASGDLRSDCRGHRRPAPSPFHRAAQVVDHDAGPTVGEQEGMGAANAASGPCHDRDTPFEAVHVHPYPPFVVAAVSRR